MGKYIKLVKTDSGYEYVTRKIGHDGAVVVIPQCYTDEGLKFQLILSTRPTFDKPILEFPAGLLDVSGESLGDAALRELKEETGWSGEAKLGIISQFPAPSSAGLSDELIYFVPVVLTEQNDPAQTAGEHIEILPLMTLQQISQYIEECGSTILMSSRLLSFLYGMMLGGVFHE